MKHLLLALAMVASLAHGGESDPPSISQALPTASMSIVDSQSSSRCSTAPALLPAHC